jgi:hypothetical protein
MENKPVANSKSVGAQGVGGVVGSESVMAVSNPRGIEPKKLGGGCQIVQMPVQPPVGK